MVDVAPKLKGLKTVQKWEIIGTMTDVYLIRIGAVTIVTTEDMGKYIMFRRSTKDICLLY